MEEKVSKEQLMEDALYAALAYIEDGCYQPTDLIAQINEALGIEY